jgi:hypothetical protein
MRAQDLSWHVIDSDDDCSAPTVAELVTHLKDILEQYRLSSELLRDVVATSPTNTSGEELSFNLDWITQEQGILAKILANTQPAPTQLSRVVRMESGSIDDTPAGKYLDYGTSHFPDEVGRLFNCHLVALGLLVILSGGSYLIGY